MKNILLIFVVFLFGCNAKQGVSYETMNLSGNHIENLEFIVKNLTQDIPNYNYKLSSKKGFVIEEEDIVGVNIYDLNIGKSSKAHFENGHAYHISPMNFQNSFSYILCVSENKLALFKSINCKDKGNKIEDVIDFINSDFSKNAELEEIINNLKNYRKYGVYLRTDAMTTLKCNCEPCK